MYINTSKKLSKYIWKELIELTLLGLIHKTCQLLGLLWAWSTIYWYFNALILGLRVAIGLKNVSSSKPGIEEKKTFGDLIT